jgi:hypothetical protein
MFGGMQKFEVLLDGGGFGRVAQQLVVGHAESCGGVHVIDVPVVEERPRLPHQRVNHVAKVDRFLPAAELPWYTLQASMAVPEFKMVLVNTHFQLQADVFAAYGIRISLYMNHTVGLHRHPHRSAGASSLRRQWTEGSDFFEERLLPGHVSPRCQLTRESHEVVNGIEVATSTQSQRLIKCVLEVTVR